MKFSIAVASCIHVAAEAEYVCYKECHDQKVSEKFHRLKSLVCSVCELWFVVKLVHTILTDSVFLHHLHIQYFYISVGEVVLYVDGEFQEYAIANLWCFFPVFVNTVFCILLPMCIVSVNWQEPLVLWHCTLSKSYFVWFSCK